MKLPFPHRVVAASLTAAVALALSACAIEFENRKPAQEIAAARKAPGSVYTGWRVFQDKCAACHGGDASGTANAPNLLPRVHTMGARQFASLVLTRYDWGQAAEAKAPGPAHEALVDEVTTRTARPLTMPAWQGEPGVNAHIIDLYAYLSARAEGTQGPGRPAP